MINLSYWQIYAKTKPTKYI